MSSGAPPRKPWLAALLSLVALGLGLLYAGRPRAALLVATGTHVAHAVMVAVALFVPGLDGLVVVAVVLLGVMYLGQVVWAVVAARRAGSVFQPTRLNRWPVYLAFIVAEAVWSRVVPLVVRFELLEPFVMPSVSMQPNLLPGDHFFVAKAGAASVLHHGDIAVVRRTTVQAREETAFVRRVIGLEGEVVEATEGVLRVDGEALPLVPCTPSELSVVEQTPGVEPISTPVRCSRESSKGGATYDVFWSVAAAPASRSFPPLRLEANELFLLGDWRDRAADDRFVGPTKRDQVVGRAIRIWFSYSPSDGVRWNRIGRRL
jgi:signal peptidase I